MASGFGTRTPMGRCFPVYMVRTLFLVRRHLATVRGRTPFAWRGASARARALTRGRADGPQEFKECISTDASSSKCKDMAEDYLECLHHKKEVRAKMRAASPSLPE